MNVFYLKNATEGLNTLPEEESKHCVKVLRMTEGETFCVTDGEGYLYDAELVEALPKRATVNLTNKRQGYDHWGFKLEIAMAPTKLNERTEWFLEKATEIGIDRVRLFTSYHSERRAANVERFQKVMVAAMKQSIKSRLPQIEDLAIPQGVHQPSRRSYGVVAARTGQVARREHTLHETNGPTQYGNCPCRHAHHLHPQLH